MSNAATPSDPAGPSVAGADAAGADAAADADVERGELVESRPAAAEDAVTSPAKVMRIGSMVKALLEEVRGSNLDEQSRERLAEIFDRSITELADALSPDLQQELKDLTLPFKDGDIPSEAEIRVAKAQLVGWLEGLFHGIQATLFAQQLAARQQLEQMRQLPQGDPRLADPGGRHGPPTDRPGTYL